MILSSDELDILEYLRSNSGKFVPLLEICRRAGGRRRYEANPEWGRSLMERLVDEDLVQIDDGGHFRLKEDDNYFPVEDDSSLVGGLNAPTEPDAPLVDDNYFPAGEG